MSVKLTVEVDDTEELVTYLEHIIPQIREGYLSGCEGGGGSCWDLESD